MSAALLDRPSLPPAVEAARTVRPVMLLTLNVPFEAPATAFAIETAAETGSDLYICDAIPLRYGNYLEQMTRRLAEEDNRRWMNAAAASARSAGVKVTQMVFHNPKPISAAVEVARNESIGLIVFGADRRLLGRWSYRRAARRLRARAACLVWTNEDEPRGRRRSR